jgi:hypothetical protein
MQIWRLGQAAAAATLMASVLAAPAMAQTVVIDLSGTDPYIVQFTGVDNSINNQQVNSTSQVGALTEEGTVLITSGNALVGVDTEVNESLVQSLAAGNNAINAFFVGDIGCGGSTGDCEEFDPTSAIIQIGSAQINEGTPADPDLMIDRDPVTIDATIERSQVGVVAGDGTDALHEGSSVEVKDNRVIASSSGNVVINQILGDLSDLTPGTPSGDNSTEANGIVNVDADVAIANAQLNNVVDITATLGDSDADPIVELADGRSYVVHVGTVLNGNVGDETPAAIEVLNNKAQALATGNDADNRIGVGLDGFDDDYVLAAANLQINQDTSVTATASGVLVGVVQGGDGPDFTNTRVRVNGNTIGAQAIGNNAVNIVGASGVGTVSP